MSALWWIAPDGTAIPVTIGPRGRTGPSVYDVWLAEGNSGTVQDFLRSVAPDMAPGVRTVDASNATAYTVPTDRSLVKVTLTEPCELDFADFVSRDFGTNPDGYTFTLRITGAQYATFEPTVAVHGSLGGATEAWCSVVRDGGWHVLVGVAG